MIMAIIRLIHPIYLDVPMLVSFSAAIQGGLSLGAEITRETESTKLKSHELSGKFGLSNLFGAFFETSVEGSLSGENANRNQEILKESKKHTEASIAILLYDYFLKNDGYITKPKDAEQLSKTKPGTLVEVSGTLVKNAVDTVIDYIDVISTLSRLNSRPTTSTKKGRSAPKSELENIRDVLDEDRKRTPMSNVILRCSEPSGMNVIVTLRTDNLRDLTFSELHKNSVQVIGKVTRVIQEGETMSPFENYGMALVDQNTLEKLFETLSSTEGITAEFSEVIIPGPAVQILPLMIYV